MWPLIVLSVGAFGALVGVSTWWAWLTWKEREWSEALWWTFMALVAWGLAIAMVALAIHGDLTLAPDPPKEPPSCVLDRDGYLIIPQPRTCRVR